MSTRKSHSPVRKAPDVPTGGSEDTAAGSASAVSADRPGTDDSRPQTPHPDQCFTAAVLDAFDPMQASASRPPSPPPGYARDPQAVKRHMREVVNRAADIEQPLDRIKEVRDALQETTLGPLSASVMGALRRAVDPANIKKKGTFGPPEFEYVALETANAQAKLFEATEVQSKEIVDKNWHLGRLP